MKGKNCCKQVLYKVFQVFLLEMQAKMKVLFNLNDNKTSRTPVTYYALCISHRMFSTFRFDGSSRKRSVVIEEHCYFINC